MGRYLRAREGTQAWLLLWLCDVQDHGGLLEDVRAAEICFAVVGGNVRQAADESSGGEPGRWTAPAETRACGACSKLAPFQLVPANPFENTLSVFASDAWTVIRPKKLERH